MDHTPEIPLAENTQPNLRKICGDCLWLWRIQENVRMTLSSARYRNFFANLNQLDELDWDAIGANDWNDPLIKEAKQSEFLLLDSFPWALIESIGVISDARRNSVLEAIANATRQPPVFVKPEWYY